MRTVTDLCGQLDSGGLRVSFLGDAAGVAVPESETGPVGIDEHSPFAPESAFDETENIKPHRGGIVLSVSILFWLTQYVGFGVVAWVIEPPRSARNERQPEGCPGPYGNTHRGDFRGDLLYGVDRCRGIGCHPVDAAVSGTRELVIQVQTIRYRVCQANVGHAGRT